MLIFIAVTTCLLLLLAQLGRFDPRLDSINIVLPYLILVGTAAAIGSFVGHRSRGHGLSLCCCVLLSLAAAQLLIGVRAEGPDAECRGHHLRLLQYNAFRDNADARPAARWVERLQPDVIALEEGTWLAPLLTRSYPYRQSCAVAGPCSTMILSRMPPEASGGAARGDPENRGALSAAWAQLPSRAGHFTIIAVHLGRPWPFARFSDDRRQLLAVVSRLDPRTTIVAGDFNLPGWTFQMRNLQQQLGLTRMTRLLLSWPARIGSISWPMPLLGIDHVLAGSAWRAHTVVTAPALGSDHRPVVIELTRCDHR